MKDISTDEVIYIEGAAATALDITATASDSGTVSYKWYSNTDKSSTSGSVIDGETEKTYTPLTTTAGTTYYYCEVTNTIANNQDGGAKTATVNSSVAMITVKAVPIPHYPITVTNGTANPATAKAGDTVAITANHAKSEEQFKKWTTTDNVSFASDTAATTTIIMPSKAVAVMATYENIPALTPTVDPDGSDDLVTPPPIVQPTETPTKTPTATPTVKPTVKPTTPVAGAVNITATVDGKGQATVNITDKNISDAVKAAQNAATQNDVAADEITAVIYVTTGGKNANAVFVNLSKSVQQQLISNKISSLVIMVDEPNITVRLNLEAIKEMNKQANADIQFTATPVDVSKLSIAAKAAIGTHPAFDLRATYANGAKTITDLQKGMASVAIAYTLTSDEIAGGMYAVYVDSKGKVNYLTNSSYDENAKMLRFSTNHLSVYGVSYKAPTNFTDITTHWAKTDSEFVTGRDLISGISDTNFKPDGTVTRGMLVAALGKLADVKASSYKADQFSDVKAGAYYAPYANWATEKNILAGTSKTQFSPNKAITRQEMAVVMHNYSKLLENQVPKTHELVTFADSSKISSQSKNAVKAMQMAGILNGKAVTGRKTIDDRVYSFNSFGETALSYTGADKKRQKSNSSRSE